MKNKLVFVIGGIFLIGIFSWLITYAIKSSFYKKEILECNQFTVTGKSGSCGEISRSSDDLDGYRLTNTYYLGKYQGLKTVGEANIIVFKTKTKSGKSVELELLLDLPLNSNGSSVIQDREREFFAGPNTKYVGIDTMNLNNYLAVNQEIVIGTQIIEITDKKQFNQIISSSPNPSKNTFLKCLESNKTLDGMISKENFLSFSKYSLGKFIGCKLSVQEIIY